MLDSAKFLLEHQINDLHSVEYQLVQALPRIVRAASRESLQLAFQSHRKKTQLHVVRLEKIAEMAGVEPAGMKCRAVEELIRKWDKVKVEEGPDELRDAALIVIAQKIGSYKLSGYGSLHALAAALGLSQITLLLDETRKEERAAAEDLSQIADLEVLPDIVRAEGERHSSKNGSTRTKFAQNQASEDVDAHRDPITGAPGAHPLGTGLGAAGGGAMVGAVGGAIGGPVGVVIGAALGALAGGFGGKAAAESINPTAETAYWRGRFTSRPYVPPEADFEEYSPAYQYGWESFRRLGEPDQSFESIEPELGLGWDQARGKSRLEWDRAKEATREAWDRVHSSRWSEKAVPS